MKYKNSYLWFVSLVFFAGSIYITQAVSNKKNETSEKKQKYTTAPYKLESINDTCLKRLCKIILKNPGNSKKLKKEFKVVRPKFSSINSAVYQSDSIYFKIKMKKFERSKHKFSYDPKDREVVRKIDNRIFWGCDGGLPRQEISGFDIAINGKKIEMPQDEYNDLYEPNIDNASRTSIVASLYISKDSHYIIYHMSNSDAAGSYEVMFIFKDGEYLRRVVVKSEC